MSDPIGTFKCPICGFDKPHTHDQGDIDWNCTGDRHGWGPLNLNQRRNMRDQAKARYEHAELRRLFEADPVAVIRNPPPGCSQCDWIFSLQELIVEKLTMLKKDGAR